MLLKKLNQKYGVVSAVFFNQMHLWDYISLILTAGIKIDCVS